MYSPTTRLLTVLELLQSYKQMSGPEMARRLEIDVRTVRRYIVMLQDVTYCLPKQTASQTTPSIDEVSA